MNAGQSVTIPMLLAGLFIVMEGDTLVKLRDKASGSSEDTTLDPETKPAILGWGIAYVTLLIMAESGPESVGSLAVAFAWLIALSVVFAVGPEWWTNLTDRISRGSLF